MSKKPAYTKPDKAWTKFIKLRAGYKCEICGRPGDSYQLHAHHYIRRDHHFFRHNPENGICLCSQCHVFSKTLSAHGTPWAFDEWLKEQKPEKFMWFNKNRWAVMPSLKLDYDKIKAALDEKIEELEGQP